MRDGIFMSIKSRRKTPVVKIGMVCIGGNCPIAVQAMTNTPTANVTATYSQTVELIRAGSELVRWTINDDKAAIGAEKVILRLRKNGYLTPIIGDFHYNGHILLREFPLLAKALDKYRINPGNVGSGDKHDDNFVQIVNIAVKNKKPVRIGVNGGSLDQGVLAKLMDANSKAKKPLATNEVVYQAMVKSALDSAAMAQKIGLRKDQIVLSVKMSRLQDMVAVYEQLAKKCDYVLHLGLTEAGGDIEGISSSSAALAILLQQGIGDTIRVSLTPQKGFLRSREVEVCQALLQSMGLSYFFPSVISCPGCGRTSSHNFQKLAEEVRIHIKKNIKQWKKKYPGVEKIKIAVMGCVVNGPGESKHADIGISLPGSSEELKAPVYIKGKLVKILPGKNLTQQFLRILDWFIKNDY
ncbi:MAG: flavodoxin-dependent (E)-4-hydroxy-3-methylbut-2-enyl-diphosphate synthase [Candidatus Omnitrophica bacterium]|nr:flavodoxin-dependent (E)-4-hydroxy-3-methylbut-2-enyl-diphosphate synthase [Candidatus Omnitrophota bacterium]